MPRVKRAINAHKKRRKILKAAKGYRGASGRLYKIAKVAVEKGLCYAYRDRRTKKREFRRLWIARINAAARLNGITYSHLVAGLNKSDITLDRKTLADIAIRDPHAFTKIASIAKTSLEA